MNKKEIYSFLIEKADFYENPIFIESDPIQIPHKFNKHEDIEIAGFLTATIAWGNRKSIIRSSNKIMEILEYSPLDFVLNHSKKDLKSIKGFVHRTFNESDLEYFIIKFREIYNDNKTLENYIYKPNISISEMQSVFHKNFFNSSNEKRIEKHVANPIRGSAAKRINMFFRWMVRSNKNGVDFGIWNKIKSHQLSCPLDVHSGNVARKLGLLRRTQNDAKAVYELDKVLRDIIPEDPVKLDFALFGLGVHEKFK
tara:strand:- start:700 stop:1461 length:762 start_codon:yes stop_codon:yes gene_type:complete